MSWLRRVDAIKPDGSRDEGSLGCCLQNSHVKSVVDRRNATFFCQRSNINTAVVRCLAHGASTERDYTVWVIYNEAGAVRRRFHVLVVRVYDRI